MKINHSLALSLVCLFCCGVICLVWGGVFFFVSRNGVNTYSWDLHALPILQFHFHISFWISLRDMIFCALVLTHLLCLKYPDWVQCLLHHLETPPWRLTDNTDLLLQLLSSSSFIFRTCESCQFIPKAWKRWEEKKWKSLMFFSELI